MEKLSVKLYISGMAFLLFGIIIAIVNTNILAYFSGGLGLFFVIVGCFSIDDSNNKVE